MIKVEYQLTALEPLFHGSDNQTSGNKRMFRRERHKITPVRVASVFADEHQRRVAALSILFGVYKSIDPKLKSEYYGYYEPFLSNVLTATHTRTKFEFLNKLLESCGVRSIHAEYGNVVLRAFEHFSDPELLYVMQQEIHYLMLMLRDLVKVDVIPEHGLIDVNRETVVFEKHFEDIPYISGNAVGGLIRRLAIRDYFARIGYERDTMGIDKSVYHELMTGGSISEKTGQIDIGKKERVAYLCPPVGVLGSALGNMTVTSVLKIGSLRPVCRELGYAFAGVPSFWELLGTSFGTRHDTSKTEADIFLENDGGRAADQMIYYNEVLNAGTEMTGRMLLTTDNPLQVSCFWHMLSLWKEFGYIAGRSARGYGAVRIRIQIPAGAADLYLAHLERVKSEALEHFTVKRHVAIPVEAN